MSTRQKHITIKHLKIPLTQLPKLPFIDPAGWLVINFQKDAICLYSPTKLSISINIIIQMLLTQKSTPLLNPCLFLNAPICSLLASIKDQKIKPDKQAPWHNYFYCINFHPDVSLSVFISPIDNSTMRYYYLNNSQIYQEFTDQLLVMHQAKVANLKSIGTCTYHFKNNAQNTPDLSMLSLKTIRQLDIDILTCLYNNHTPTKDIEKILKVNPRAVEYAIHKMCQQLACINRLDLAVFIHHKPTILQGLFYHFLMRE
ncbi:hypothetical protein [Facilibium subflavum]|uniref:hypothetical protein n=1 Tax=Facilibium subflavum TaxID=2219058 RepID=UPI000E65BD13|nr:hypothetical protein [Facilibium subflavum]